MKRTGHQTTGSILKVLIDINELIEPRAGFETSIKNRSTLGFERVTSLGAIQGINCSLG